MGEERRTNLLKVLKESRRPVKAAELAKIVGVSRQVIVQDMTLLRAKNEPLMATPQGYVYLGDPEATGIRRVISSCHSPEDTAEELNTLVDHGVTVLDVGVEHSVYGRIFRPLGLKTRMDVKKFINQMAEQEANLLCSLTGGIHLHTLEGPTEEILDQACQELKRKGFLLEQNGRQAQPLFPN